MQFYLNGFRGGDPDIHPPARPEAPPLGEEVLDVLIVGGGPAGLLLGAQLAAFGDLRTRLVERRDGPLVMGQADGVACRTVETFQAFGLADRLMREAYWVNETVFWGPAAGDGADPAGLARVGRVRDVAEGLSEFPHLIVNQARLQDLLTWKMAVSPGHVVPDYGLTVTGVDVPADPGAPVTVRLARAGGAEVTVQARYVVGCDGARSAVRTAIGRELHGDVQNRAWGVLDVLAVTDFPDIRHKAVIQSGAAGNMLIIPREGGYLVRLYVDLGDVAPGDRSVRERTTADDVIATARRILAPYTLDVREVVWSSVYEVGQRLTDGFDDAAPGRPARVFIAGDACHTHSAKAGQGMNVSMQDTFNLGWKLAAVLRGRAPEALLATYDAERRPVAAQLIDFDKGSRRSSAAGPGR